MRFAKVGLSLEKFQGRLVYLCIAWSLYIYVKRNEIDVHIL